jgi:hypothetical protein
MRFGLAGVFSFIFVACAAGGSSDDGTTPGAAGDSGAGGGTRDAGDGHDAQTQGDSAPASDGDASGTCTLGTTDHCGACDHACRPTDKTTQYACSDATAAATCLVTCLAEFYDLNGNADDGCEAEDAPVQDTAASAKPIDLPDVNDPMFKTNPLNVVGFVYGDGRPHEAPPTSRPFGREDWYHVTADGNGSGQGMAACLGITNFPPDDTFEVCVSDNNGTTFPQTGCKTVKGGANSVCVTPTGNPNAGVYYVRVRKTDGSNTANGYALFLRH